MARKDTRTVRPVYVPRFTSRPTLLVVPTRRRSLSRTTVPPLQPPVHIYVARATVAYYVYRTPFETAKSPTDSPRAI